MLWKKKKEKTNKSSRVRGIENMQDRLGSRETVAMSNMEVIVGISEKVSPEERCEGVERLSHAYMRFGELRESLGRGNSQCRDCVEERAGRSQGGGERDSGSPDGGEVCTRL